MHSRRFLLALAAAAACGSAFAQAWPAKPIRLVVPFPAGNIGIGIDNVAKSPVDGYSLVLGQTSALAVLHA